MNTEQIKATSGETGKEAEQVHIRARNMMQIALTKRHCAGWEKKEMEQWLSQVLSPLFHELVRKKPELLFLYEKTQKALLPKWRENCVFRTRRESDRRTSFRTVADTHGRKYLPRGHIIKPVRRSERVLCFSVSVPRWLRSVSVSWFYFTASFSPFAARNFGTFIAATCTISPVRGFRA